MTTTITVQNNALTCPHRVHRVDKLAYWAGKEIHIRTRNLVGNLQNKFAYYIHTTWTVTFLFSILQQ